MLSYLCILCIFNCFECTRVRTEQIAFLPWQFKLCKGKAGDLKSKHIYISIGMRSTQQKIEIFRRQKKSKPRKISKAIHRRSREKYLQQIKISSSRVAFSLFFLSCQKGSPFAAIPVQTRLQAVR